MRIVYLFVLIALLVPSLQPTPAGAEVPAAGAGLALSGQEREWLARHRVIRVGIGENGHESDPFTGELCHGIAFDYLTLACRKLGISVLPVSGLDHQRLLSNLGRPGGVDVLLDLPHTPELDAQVAWTAPYLRSPQVIFTRKDGHFVFGVTDLAGKTVALSGESELAPLLLRDAPRVRLLKMTSVNDALLAVSRGRADATVQNLAVGTYGIERSGISDLKVAAPAPYPEHQMSLAVRRDWPELAHLLDKAMLSLSAQEQEDVRHRWLTLRYEHGIRPGDVAGWLTVLGLCALIAITLLRRIIRSRTAALVAEINLRSLREQELEREKRFVDHVIESIPGLFFLHDGRNLLRCNTAFQRVTGLSAAQLSEQPPLSLIHHEERDLMVELREEIMEQGEAQWEARLLTAEGARWHFFTGKRMQLDGKAYVVGTARDITDRKLGERALKESERRFSDMLENLRLIAIMFDAENRVTFCNDFLLELTGWQRSEVIGRNWFDMFYPDADEARRSFHASIGHGIVSLHRERTILTRQGGRRIISWNSTLLRSPEGEEIGAACIGEDITDRRHYEEALQKITEGVSATTGKAFFQSLVCHLTDSLEVDYAIVAELGEGSLMHTVAVCAQGELLDNFCYSLAGTPCEDLRHSGPVMIDGEVRARYPEVCFLADHAIESFAGVPLFSGSGELLGTLTVLGKGAFANSDLVGAMLGVFAGRAAAEMERTRAEEALKESEERYRLLFDRMLNGYAVCEMITDQEGRAVDYRFLEVNASFATLTRLKRAELIGRTALELMPQTEAAWIERLGRVALTEQPDQFEEFSRGLGKWLKVAAYSPQPGLFAATFADVTKRREAEQAVTESEEHVRQIFAQSDDGLILFEMDSFRIIEANPAALRLYGTSRDELKELKPWAVISPTDFRKLIRAISRDEREGGFQLERAACYRSDGSTFTGAIRGKVLTLRNEYVVLCSVRDVTAKARLEDEMKASQAKLIQANKMTSLGMLVSGVAHEINNPNNYISVNSLMLTDVWRDAEPVLRAHRDRHGDFDLGGLPFSEMEVVVPRLLSGITQGSSRITSIVNNMRKFVRKEEDGGERPVDVNQTIDSAVSLLWHHIHRHTDSFTISLAEELPMARGSAQQIEQVIINLVMNALQALPGKECGVRIQSGVDEEDGMITISVIDEGYGMNKKVRKHLAEPFFSTKIDKGGTGLGLYISSSIIKDHGGSLTFQSTVGKGTAATIRLPHYQGAPQADLRFPFEIQ